MRKNRLLSLFLPLLLAFVSVDAEDDLGGFLKVFHVVYME